MDTSNMDNVITEQTIIDKQNVETDQNAQSSEQDSNVKKSFDSSDLTSSPSPSGMASENTDLMFNIVSEMSGLHHTLLGDIPTQVFFGESGSTMDEEAEGTDTGEDFEHLSVNDVKNEEGAETDSNVASTTDAATTQSERKEHVSDKTESCESFEMVNADDVLKQGAGSNDTIDSTASSSESASDAGNVTLEDIEAWLIETDGIESETEMADYPLDNNNLQCSYNPLYSAKPGAEDKSTANTEQEILELQLTESGCCRQDSDSSGMSCESNGIIVHDDELSDDVDYDELPSAEEVPTLQSVAENDFNDQVGQRENPCHPANLRALYRSRPVQYLNNDSDKASIIPESIGDHLTDTAEDSETELLDREVRSVLMRQQCIDKGSNDVEPSCLSNCNPGGPSVTEKEQQLSKSPVMSKISPSQECFGENMSTPPTHSQSSASPTNKSIEAEAPTNSNIDKSNVSISPQHIDMHKVQHTNTSDENVGDSYSIEGDTHGYDEKSEDLLQYSCTKSISDKKTYSNSHEIAVAFAPKKQTDVLPAITMIVDAAQMTPALRPHQQSRGRSLTSSIDDDTTTKHVTIVTMNNTASDDKSDVSIDLHDQGKHKLTKSVTFDSSRAVKEPAPLAHEEDTSDVIASSRMRHLSDSETVSVRDHTLLSVLTAFNPEDNDPRPIDDRGKRIGTDAVITIQQVQPSPAGLHLISITEEKPRQDMTETGINYDGNVAHKLPRVILTHVGDSEAKLVCGEQTRQSDCRLTSNSDDKSLSIKMKKLENVQPPPTFSHPSQNLAKPIESNSFTVVENYSGTGLELSPDNAAQYHGKTSGSQVNNITPSSAQSHAGIHGERYTAASSAQGAAHENTPQKPADCVVIATRTSTTISRQTVHPQNSESRSQGAYSSGGVDNIHTYTLCVSDADVSSSTHEVVRPIIEDDAIQFNSQGGPGITLPTDSMENINKLDDPDLTHSSRAQYGSADREDKGITVSIVSELNVSKSHPVENDDIDADIIRMSSSTIVDHSKDQSKERTQGQDMSQCQTHTLDALPPAGPQAHLNTNVTETWVNNQVAVTSQLEAPDFDAVEAEISTQAASGVPSISSSSSPRRPRDIKQERALKQIMKSCNPQAGQVSDDLVLEAMRKLKMSPFDSERARSLVDEPVTRRSNVRSHSPGAVRHYDWNSTHFYPDIIDIDTSELAHPPDRYTHPVAVHPHTEQYPGQQPRTIIGIKVDYNDMKIFAPPTPPTPECLTSSEDDDSLERTEMNNTARYIGSASRYSAFKVPSQSKVTSSLDDLRYAYETDTTDSESSTEQHRVWQKSPLYVKRTKRRERPFSSEISFTAPTPPTSKRGQNAGRQGSRHKRRLSIDNPLALRRTDSPCDVEHSKEKNGVQSQADFFEYVRQKRKALKTSSQENIPRAPKRKQETSNQVTSKRSQQRENIPPHRENFKSHSKENGILAKNPKSHSLQSNTERYSHNCVYENNVVHENVSHQHTQRQQLNQTSAFKVRYEPLRQPEEDQSTSPTVRLQRRSRQQRFSSFEKLYDGVELESFCQEETIPEQLLELENASQSGGSNSASEQNSAHHESTKGMKLDAKSLIKQEQQKYEVYKAEFMRQHSSHSEHSEDCDDNRHITNEYDYKMTRIAPKQPDINSTGIPISHHSQEMNHYQKENMEPDNEYDYFLKRHIRSEKKIIRASESDQRTIPTKMQSIRMEQRGDVQRRSGREQFDVEQYRQVGHERLNDVHAYTEEDVPTQFHRRPSDRFKEYNKNTRNISIPVTNTLQGAPVAPTKTRLSAQIMDHIKQQRNMNNNVIQDNRMLPPDESSSKSRDLFKDIEFIDDEEDDNADACDSAAVSGITEILNMHQSTRQPKQPPTQSSSVQPHTQPHTQLQTQPHTQPYTQSYTQSNTQLHTQPHTQPYTQSHTQPHAYTSNSYVKLRQKERRSSLDESLTDDNRSIHIRNVRKQPRPSSLTFGEDHIYNMHTSSTTDHRYNSKKEDPDFRSVLQQWLVSDEVANTASKRESLSYKNLHQKRAEETMKSSHHKGTGPSNDRGVSYQSQEWREGDTSIPIYAKPLSKSTKKGWELDHSRIISGDERLSPQRSEQYEEDPYSHSAHHRGVPHGVGRKKTCEQYVDAETVRERKVTQRQSKDRQQHAAEVYDKHVIENVFKQQFNNEQQKRYESQLEKWETERNAWKQLMVNKKSDPYTYYHNQNLEQQLEELQNPMRQQQPPYQDQYYQAPAKASYDNQAFEFEPDESVNKAATEMGNIRYDHKAHKNLDPYSGRKSADDILSASSSSLNKPKQTYLTDDHQYVPQKTYLIDDLKNIPQTTYLTDDLQCIPQKTYLTDDPVQQQNYSRSHAKRPEGSPTHTATWEQGAVNSANKQQQQCDTSAVTSNELSGGTLSPYQQQLNAILYKDQYRSQSQPTSPVRSSKVSQYNTRSQQSANLNLFRPITNSSRKEQGDKRQPAAIRHTTISKEILKKRRSNIQDELTELEKHFEELGLDSEDDSTIPKTSTSPKPINYHLQRTIVRERHEPSPESLEVAQYNWDERMQQRKSPQVLNNQTEKLVSEAYVTQHPPYHTSQDIQKLGNAPQRRNSPNKHFNKPYQQHTKPGTIRPLHQQNEKCTPESHHLTQPGLVNQPGLQYGAQGCKVKQQPKLIIRPRSASMERPQNGDGDGSKSEPSSPLKHRRPSLPGRKTYAQGITQMVNVFSTSTLRPSNSEPNLTDRSVFSSSYSVTGEPITVDANDATKSKVKSRKQQTPRIVKHRSEQKNKTKPSTSGSESEGYSSSGVESSLYSDHHTLKPHDLSSGSSGLDSQSSGECLSVSQKGNYKETMDHLISLPERESFTSRSAPNLYEQPHKQTAVVQKHMPDTRNIHYQQQPPPPSRPTKHSIQVTPSPPPPSSPDKPLPNVTVTVQTRQSPMRATQPAARPIKKQLANSRTLELVDPVPLHSTQPSKIPQASSASPYAPLRAPTATPRYSYNSDTSFWDSTDQSYSVVLSPENYTPPCDSPRVHNTDDQLSEITKAVAKVEPTVAGDRPKTRKTTLSSTKLYRYNRPDALNSKTQNTSISSRTSPQHAPPVMSLVDNINHHQQTRNPSDRLESLTISKTVTKATALSPKFASQRQSLEACQRSSPNDTHNYRFSNNPVLVVAPHTTMQPRSPPSDEVFNHQKSPATDMTSFTSVSSGAVTPLYRQHPLGNSVNRSQLGESMSSLGSSNLPVSPLSTTPTLLDDSITDTSTAESVNSYKHSISSGSIKLRPTSPEEDSTKMVLAKNSSTWNFNSESTMTERMQQNHQIKTIKSFVSMERQGVKTPPTPTTPTRVQQIKGGPSYHRNYEQVIRSPPTRRAPSAHEMSEAESDTLDRLVVNQNIGEYSDIEISDYENFESTDGAETMEEGDHPETGFLVDEATEAINTYQIPNTMHGHHKNNQYTSAAGLTRFTMPTIAPPVDVTSWQGHEERQTTPTPTPTPDSMYADECPLLTTSGVMLRPKNPNARDRSPERRRSIKQLVNSFDSMASPFC